MLIQQDNLLHKDAVKTFLTHTEVSGTNVLRWRNPNGFAASWAVQVGEMGQEQTEVVLLGTATPSGTAGTLTANTLYEHPADTPLYALKYNQVVFERSTTGTAGTATPMTGGTITYQADSLFTQFDDTSGSVSYAYRTLFRNSVLSVETTESDWIVIAPSFYSLAVIRDRTKGKLWNSDFLDNPTIDDWTNELKDKLTNAAIQANEDYALGTVNVAFVSTGLGTVTTGDFKQPRRVWVTYNGVDEYQSTKIEVNDDSPNRVYNSTHPYHYWLGDDVFQIQPPESGGTAKLVFYRMGTPMVNDTDELPRYMRGYTDKFVEYNLLQAQYKDQKISYSDKNIAEKTLIEDFVVQLTPRDKSGAQYINVVEAISGEDYL